MKRKIGAAVALGLLATALSATVATAQCDGVMIKFDGDAWAYETIYNTSTLMSTAGSQLTVVGIVSLFCPPFLDLNPANPDTEYTFIWDGLTSLGTVAKVRGSGMQYTTNYLGGGFRIYAGSPRNAPTATSLPALPAPGVVPDLFVDGPMILSAGMDTLVVIVSRNSLGTYSGSFRANYQFTGGTLYNRVTGLVSLMDGGWCVVPPSGAPGGTCLLPTGWTAHPNGKVDPVPAVPSTWGMIKTLYR
jgi:hypothetical protein